METNWLNSDYLQDTHHPPLHLTHPKSMLLYPPYFQEYTFSTHSPFMALLPCLNLLLFSYLPCLFSFPLPSPPPRRQPQRIFRRLQVVIPMPRCGNHDPLPRRRSRCNRSVHTPCTSCWSIDRWRRAVSVDFCSGAAG